MKSIKLTPVMNSMFTSLNTSASASDFDAGSPSDTALKFPVTVPPLGFSTCLYSLHGISGASAAAGDPDDDVADANTVNSTITNDSNGSKGDASKSHNSSNEGRVFVEVGDRTNTGITVTDADTVHANHAMSDRITKKTNTKSKSVTKGARGKTNTSNRDSSGKGGGESGVRDGEGVAANAKESIENEYYKITFSLVPAHTAQ